MKPLVCAMLLALPAVAEWPRLIVDNGQWVDRPEPHPLKYFTECPWRRNAEPCPAGAAAKRKELRVEVRPLGKVRGFGVYDLLYFRGEADKPESKSILVQVGPDSYREIYHDNPTEGVPNPSFLVNGGGDTVLCVADNVYKWDVEEECFWFEPAGVVRLDFTPVWQAAQKAIPADRRVWEYNLKAGWSFPRMTIPVGIRYESNNRCCDSGVVSVHFRIDRGRVVVTRSQYDPDATYQW